MQNLYQCKPARLNVVGWIDRPKIHKTITFYPDKSTPSPNRTWAVTSSILVSSTLAVPSLLYSLLFARSFRSSGHVWVKVVSLVLYRWVVNRNMANNLALGVIEIQNEHSGDESDDDVDDVVENSPCGRWEKRRQEVRKF